VRDPSTTPEEAAEKVWRLSQAANSIDCEIVAIEQMLGLDEPQEGAQKVPAYEDMPRRLDQLIGWLADAGRRAVKITLAVAKLKDTVG